jgi:hypothetical protein
VYAAFSLVAMYLGYGVFRLTRRGFADVV